MMKTGKPALQGAIASCSSVESNLAYPNSSLKISTGLPATQAKGKLNRFKITASILKQTSSLASPRPPEASNGLLNGLLASEEGCSEPSSQWRNCSKDISDFSLLQKCHWSVKQVPSGSGEVLREMYSLSEEAGESGGSDTEEQSKDVLVKTKEELLVNKTMEEFQEDKTKLKINSSLECEDKQTEDEETLGSPRKEA